MVNCSLELVLISIPSNLLGDNIESDNASHKTFSDGYITDFEHFNASEFFLAG
jgi:hypothetical protein